MVSGIRVSCTAIGRDVIGGVDRVRSYGKVTEISREVVKGCDERGVGNGDEGIGIDTEVMDGWFL